MKYKKHLLKGILSILLISLTVSCDKENQCEILADVPVNITIYPNSTEYQELNTVNGWLYLTARKPSKGIIVFRAGPDRFKAYERTCPHDPENPDARLQVDEETTLIAYDTVCGSQFVLTTGQPFDGPAQCPMKEYQTNYNGNELRIYN
ncbi:MAG: hypothetical protein K9I68_12070 [Bacteroidales bacterium]|nr:hypothetical protein [Bacteroidales bacterium]